MRRWLKSKISQVSVCPLDSPSHPRGTWMTQYLALSVEPLTRQTKGRWCERHETPYLCFEDEIFSTCAQSKLPLRDSMPAFSSMALYTRLIDISFKLYAQFCYFIRFRLYQSSLFVFIKAENIIFPHAHHVSKNTFYRIQNWDVNMCRHISYLQLSLLHDNTLDG